MSSRYTSTRGTFESPASWRYSSSSSSSTSSSRPSSFDYSSPFSSRTTASGGYGRSSRLADVESVGKGYSTSASAVASPRSHDTGVSSISSARLYDTGVSTVSSPRSYDYGLRSSGSTELGTRYVSRSSSVKGDDSSDSSQRLTRGSYARSSIPTRSGNSPRGSRSSLSSEPAVERKEEAPSVQGVGTATDYSARRERLRAAGLASSSGDSYRSFSSSRDDDATSASSVLWRSQRAQNGSTETAGQDAASGRQGSREPSSWRHRRGLASENGSSMERSSEAESSKEPGTRSRRTPASTEELLSRASALRRSRRQMEQEEREKEEREKEEREKKEKEEREKKEKEEREKKEKVRSRENRYDTGGKKKLTDFVSHPVVTATIFTAQRSGERVTTTKEDGKKGDMRSTEAELESTATRSSLRRFRGDKDAAEENTSAAKPEESSSEPRTFRRYGQRSARTEGQGQPKVEVMKVTAEPSVELQKTASSITISERLSPTELARDEASKPAAQEVKTSSSSSSSSFASHKTVPPSSHTADARTDWKDSALSSSRDGARSGRGDFVYNSGKQHPDSTVTAAITVKKSWREEAEKARALTTKMEDSQTAVKTEVGSGEGPADALDARAQRIARYKEERRQQLETMMSTRQKFFSGPGSSDSGSDSKPSLFLSCSSKGDDSDDATASKGIRRSKSAAEKHSPRADSYKADSDSGETSRMRGNLTRTASSHIPRQTTEAAADAHQDPVVLDTSNITVRTRKGRQLPQPKGQDVPDGDGFTKTSQSTHSATESSRSALGKDAADRQRLDSSESRKASREVETPAGPKGERSQVERSPSSRSPRIHKKLAEVKRSASDASSATKVTVPIRETLDTARITYFKTGGSGERSRADTETASTASKSRDVNVTARTFSKTEFQPTAGGEEAKATVTVLSPVPTVLDELLEKNAAFLSDMDATAVAAGAAPRLLSVGENPAGRKSLKRRPGQRSSRPGSSDSESRVTKAVGDTRGSKEDAVFDTPTLASTEVKVEVKDTMATTTVPSAVVRMMQSSSVDDPDVTARTHHRDVTRGAEPTTSATAAASLGVDGKVKEGERDGEKGFKDHPPKSPTSRRGELGAAGGAEKDLPPRSPSSRRRAGLGEPAVTGGGDKDLPPKSSSSRRRARLGDDSLDRDEAAPTTATVTSLASKDVSSRSPASRRKMRHADGSPSSSDVTTDRAGRRRFITRPPEPRKDSGSDSVFDTAPSNPSTPDLSRRRQRKDKSNVRKSELNKSEDNEASNQSSASVGTDRSVDKISAAVHMFQEPQADSKKTATLTEAKIPRRADFSQLVKKFSSSEGSASEKSDAEKQLHRRPIIRRQNPVEKGSSSDESNTEYARRTPERTQSLRMQSPSSGAPTQGGGVRRTGSFQSKFMRERFDPASDQPNPELAAVLSQRKTIVAMQEEESVTFRSDHDVKVVEREETKAKGTNRISEVIADQELASVLRSRRKETDAKSGLAEEAEDDKKEKKSVAEKVSTRPGKDGGVAVESQSETNVSFIYSVNLPGEKPSSSKSGLYAIDSSLAILAKATKELDTPQEEATSSSTTAASRVPGSRPADSDSDSAFASSDSTAKRGGTLADAVKYIQDVETSISSRVATSASQASSQTLSRSAASVNTPQVTSASVVTATTTSRTHAKSSPEREEAPSVTLTISLPPVEEDSSSTPLSSSSHSVSVPSSKKATSTTTAAAASSSLSSSSSSLSTKTATTPSSVKSIAADLVSTKSSIQATAAISTPNLAARPEEPAPNKSLSTSHTDVDRISPSREDSSSSHSTFTLSLSSAASSPRLDTSAEALPGSRTGSGLRRAESLKDCGTGGGEESRRGVLKRTPSLPKQQARLSPGVIIDPQLADIMKKMREKEGNLDEEEEEDKETRQRTLSAAEEIELARRERRTSSSSSVAMEVEGVKGGEEEDTPLLSVAERILRMQCRMEETNSTPRSRSGHTTPRSPARNKSGTVTPVWQVSIEGVTETSSTTEDVERASAETGKQNHRQLLERLSSLATEQADTVSVLERRQRFQRRQRDDWRTRTTPVTQEEVCQADSLESVSAFRALVRRQATINMFDKLKEGERPGPAVTTKRPEFPQHLTPAKRQQPLRARQLRHKTLPITAAELAAIPEGESMASESLKSKVAEMGRLQAQADSGIVSGSELESMLEREHQHSDSLRSLTLEMDIAEDDPSRLPVSAKTSIFRSMEEKTKQEKERFRLTASGAKRYIERKKRERSMTQPVTEEEVKDAAELAVDTKPKVTIHKPEVVNRPKTPPQEPDEPAVEENDEFAKLSLKDKVKLFSEQRKASEEKPLPPTEPPVRRRPRKHASRFSTQPVTVEEVQEAATSIRVTPLMLSLVKPPDSELLGGMPLNAQRDLAMQHCIELMAQHPRPPPRSGSQPSSRKSSLSESSAESKTEARGILKTSDSQSEGRLSPELHGILKADTATSKEPAEPRSILKRGSVDLKLSDVETKGILKHSDSTGSGVQDPRAAKARDFGGEPRGILKNSRSLDGENGRGLGQEGEPRGILKQESAEVPVRGILKRESSFDTGKSEKDKGVLKKTDSKEGEETPIRGILKRDNSESVDRTSPEAEAAGFYLGSDEGDKKGGEESDPREETSPPREEGETRTKRRIHNRKNQAERYKTQPVDSTPETPSPRRPKYYEGRHMTQPVTPDEMKQAEASSSSSPVMKASSSGSIADRLHALKKSGEEEWKKRVTKSPSPELAEVRLREKPGIAACRPSSIADRLTALEGSQASWKTRVEEGDASNFTVTGRLTKRGGNIVESPLVARLKNTPKKEAIVGSANSSVENSPATSPTLPAVEFRIRVPLPKEIISDGPIQVQEQNKSRQEEEAREAVRVEVPAIADEDLDAFFQVRRVEDIKEKIDVSIDDFNNIFIEANDMLPTVRRIRPSRRKKAVSRNPLKNISVEVRHEYTEVTMGVADREMKRMKREKVAAHAGLAEAALAGLASQENFSKVELRRTEEATTIVPGNQPRYEPYSELMLLHFKGRRSLQVRLVEPVASSLNSGDCFVLVTPDKIYNWVGDFANVIEKARSADVALYIQQKRDMGCRSGVALFTVEEAKSHLGPGKQFWAAIGGRVGYMGVGPDEEDELFESAVVRTNAIYQLKGNALLPYEEYWGAQPKFSMLQREEVLVLDFGSELYVWMGKAVDKERRKLGLKLAQQLWEKDYDYSECVINPLCPLKDLDHGSLPMKGKRPPWALFGKISQNMETILFREKFADWPDSSRLISVKGMDKTGQAKGEGALDLKPHDAKLLVPLDTRPVTLVLEGSNVGRGNKWFEDMEGFIREVEIMTLGVSVWHVMEYDHFKLDEASYGQMHEGDTYVVRWQYMISTTGHRSRFSLTGRERCAYYFWQGKQSTINEKGASALMTVELDEERGPQVRVVQGKEPPCFLSLFGGAMVVHVGKREDPSTSTKGSWRLYALRGGPHQNEACLLEIPLAMDHFRSRSSLLLLDVSSGSLFVWHGCKADKNTRAVAMSAAQKIKDNKPKETGLEEGVTVTVAEVEEGSETNDFWRGFTSKRRTKYCSLRSVFKSFDHTLRLFLMTSVSGVFEAMEVPNPSRDHTTVVPFPFLQSDLYKATQPALLLLDSHHEVYLWQGWWPLGSEEQENVRTGSAHARFNVDRRCAMETTLHYCKEKNPSRPPPAFMVYAGAEPLEFTNLFPFWEQDNDVMRLAAQEGRAPGDTPSVEEILAKLTKTRYTLEELQAETLPEGVDPMRIESYLEDKEFEELFEMTKEEYNELQPWRQRQLKQQVGLF